MSAMPEILRQTLLAGCWSCGIDATQVDTVARNAWAAGVGVELVIEDLLAKNGNQPYRPEQWATVAEQWRAARGDRQDGTDDSFLTDSDRPPKGSDSEADTGEDFGSFVERAVCDAHQDSLNKREAAAQAAAAAGVLCAASTLIAKQPEGRKVQELLELFDRRPVTVSEYAVPVYLDFQVEGRPTRVHIQLSQGAPVVAGLFLARCRSREPGFTFQGAPLERRDGQGVLQLGRATSGDLRPVPRTVFAAEFDPRRQHVAGSVSVPMMSDSAPVFQICPIDMPWLDGTNVVFGRVVSVTCGGAAADAAVLRGVGGGVVVDGCGEVRFGGGA